MSNKALELFEILINLLPQKILNFHQSEITILGKVKANFLRHEGYLGAIGAFLKGCEAENADIEVLKPFGNLDNFSWTENLYGSTPSFQDPIIGSGAWQSGSKASTLDGIRKRTKSASASMAGN